MTVILPTTKSEKKQTWTNQKFLTIGQPGVGKSEFWAAGDKTFFFDTEGNLEHLSVYKAPCRSWSDFRDIYTALMQQKAAGQLMYDTICIDTLDRWMDYAREEVIDRAHKKYSKAIADGLSIGSVGDIPEGNGWAWMRELVTVSLGKLQDLGCALSLVGHVQEKRVEDAVKKYDRATLNVGGQLGIMLTGWSNHTLHIEGIYSGTDLTRIVYTIPSQSREAKSHGGLIRNGWKWEKDSKVNFEKMRALFN